VVPGFDYPPPNLTKTTTPKVEFLFFFINFTAYYFIFIFLVAGYECEPEQHVDFAGDVHRRLGVACGVRAGRHSGNARGDERRRLCLRGPSPVGVRHRPGWIRGRRRATRGRVAEEGEWMSSDGGVPDSREQSPDGEADGGVGGDREQPHLVHRAEDKSSASQRELSVTGASRDLFIIITIILFCFGD